MNVSATMVGIALVAGVGLSQGTASVKTKAGLVSGEIQGTVVAKRDLQGGSFDLAVIDGRAIRTIDERGIFTAKVAWQTISPIAGIQMPPHGRIAERMVERQVDRDPAEALTFRVLGELPMDTTGNATGDIVPRLRLRTSAGQRLISIEDLVPLATATP